MHVICWKWKIQVPSFLIPKIGQLLKFLYETFHWTQSLRIVVYVCHIKRVCIEKKNQAFTYSFTNFAIFSPNFRGLLSTFSGNSSESPYYPLGSEASMRPFSPKFIIEENSSNYEPVMVSNRALAVTPVIGISPMLPKRYVYSTKGPIIYFFWIKHF